MALFLAMLLGFVLTINSKFGHASLIIEEEAEGKGLSETKPGKPNANPASIFTDAEKKNLIGILEQQYKSKGQESFEKFSESLSQYLHPPSTDKQPFPRVESRPPRGGWSSSQSSSHGQCRVVGYSCSSGGWGSKDEEEVSGEDTVNTENDDSKNVGWGSGGSSNNHQGWGNHGKCCNNDLCLHGKCCIPTPSRRSNSNCRKNEDCCNGGLCHKGKCLKPVGTSCTDSYECYKSDCVNSVCCIQNTCSNSTKSYDADDTGKCTYQSDCCAKSGVTTVCSDGKCQVLKGDSCDCSEQCANELSCEAGKCCIAIGKSCSKSSDCCSSVSCYKGKCQSPATMFGSRAFQFLGEDF